MFPPRFHAPRPTVCDKTLPGDIMLSGIPSNPVVISICAALLSGGLALYSLVRTGRSFSNIVFSLGMLALAIEAVISVFSLQATSARDLIFWESWRVAIAGFVLGIWLIFSVRYARRVRITILQQQIGNGSPWLSLLSRFCWSYHSGIFSSLEPVWASTGGRSSWAGRVIFTA